MERREFEHQIHAGAKRSGIDLHVLELAEAEQVRHALADRQHGERTAFVNLQQAPQPIIVGGTTLDLNPDRGNRLAEVVVDLGGGGRRGQQRQKQRSCGRQQPGLQAPEHQKVCLTRTSSEYVSFSLRERIHERRSFSSYSRSRIWSLNDELRLRENVR